MSRFWMVSQFVVVYTLLHHEFFVFIISAGTRRHYYCDFFIISGNLRFSNHRRWCCWKRWKIASGRYCDLGMYCQFYVLSCPVCGLVNNALCNDVKCLVAWCLCLWSGNPLDISPCYILTVSAQDRTCSVSALVFYFHSTRWSPFHWTLMLSVLYIFIRRYVHSSVHFDSYFQINKKKGECYIYQTFACSLFIHL
jgi:hypothetical protein